jgi:hypothetical protein
MVSQMVSESGITIALQLPVLFAGTLMFLELKLFFLIIGYNDPFLY